MKSKTATLLSILAIVLATLACGVKEVPGVTEVSAPPEPTATSTPDYSGPCANVLFPFIPGRQWVYQKMGADPDGATPDPLTSKFGLTVAEVTETQAVLNTLDMGTGATTQTSVECQDGAITNFPMMILGSLVGNYLTGDIESVYVSGVFAPTQAELDAASWDMEWAGEYVASGTVTFTAEGESTTVILNNSPITMTWQNAGQETITVPADTYEGAYKVTRTMVVEASILYEGMTAEGTVTIVSDHWFAPFVGLLKTEIVSVSVTTFGITFPVEVSGSVELVETH